MPTQASQAALIELRDLTMIKWYVIPLLAFTIYSVPVITNLIGKGSREFSFPSSQTFRYVGRQ